MLVCKDSLQRRCVPNGGIPIHSRRMACRLSFLAILVAAMCIVAVSHVLHFVSFFSVERVASFERGNQMSPRQMLLSHRNRGRPRSSPTLKETNPSCSLNLSAIRLPTQVCRMTSNLQFSCALRIPAESYTKPHSISSDFCNCQILIS